MQAEFALKQKAELKAIEAARAAGLPIPERQYTDDKAPKVDPSLIPRELRGKTFEQLRAMQAQAKKAPPAPTSPVSSLGGRPASTSTNRQLSSSPDSPGKEQTVPGTTASAVVSTLEAQPSKTARAKLFKSEQSSPDAAHTSAVAASRLDRQNPELPPSNGDRQVSAMLSQQQQQQKQIQKEPEQQQQQQHKQQLTSALAPLQQQQQQQHETGMQQLAKPFGPVNLRDSVKMELVKNAPSGTGLPENVRQYFQKLISSSVELSVEQHALRQSMEEQGAKAWEYRQQLEDLQGQLEYQAEQMMDLQNQVTSAYNY